MGRSVGEFLLVRLVAEKAGIDVTLFQSKLSESAWVEEPHVVGPGMFGCLLNDGANDGRLSQDD
jgi:hypothetical protein